MWDISRCDEDEKHLEFLLTEGWEPFAVTVENRVERSYDNYHERSHDEQISVNVVWLRKRCEEKK